METIGQTIRRFRLEAGLSQSKLADLVPVNKSNLSRFEGDQQKLTPRIAERLDRLLNTNGALSALIQPPELAASDEPRRPADASYVDGLRTTIQSLVALDNFHGGNNLSCIATRTFGEANEKLASGNYAPGIERDLEAATAELGELAGWLLYDADRQDESRRVNFEALNLSRLAGDRSMELFVLTNMSMQMVHAHRPREALKIAQNTIECTRLPHRVVTLLKLREARALASLGDRSAITEMGRARAAIADSVRTTDPQWTWWVNQCQLDWHEAMMHASLGDWPAAIDWFSKSLELVRNTRRGLYVHTAYLLDALVRAGDWGRAETVAMDALPLVGEAVSGRPTRLLRDTAAVARQSGAPSTVSDVFAAIGRRLTS